MVLLLELTKVTEEHNGNFIFLTKSIKLAIPIIGKHERSLNLQKIKKGNYFKNYAIE